MNGNVSVSVNVTAGRRLPLTGTRPKGPLGRTQQSQWERIQREILIPMPNDLDNLAERCGRAPYLRWYRGLTQQYRQMPRGKKKDDLRYFLDLRGGGNLIRLYLQLFSRWRP